MSSKSSTHLFLRKVFQQSSRRSNDTDKLKKEKKKSKKGLEETVRVPSRLTSFFLSRIGKVQGSAADASRKAMQKKAKKSKKDKKQKSKSDKQQAEKAQEPSLQMYFDIFLRERGYSANTYESLDCAYHCRPTELQKASYGLRVNQAARFSDVDLLQRLFHAGLSPNPCNKFGESLIHMVCRRGNIEILHAMLEAGCSVQVTDDYGRTPLHDACWGAEPNFEIIQLILESDKNLLRLVDARGSTPLKYVAKEHWPRWIQFLTEQADHIWPRRDLELEGEEYAPSLTKRGPHTLPIPDPANALSLEVAELVSNGRLEPEDAVYLPNDGDDSSCSDESSYHSDDDTYTGITEDDDFDFEEEEELEELYVQLGGGAVAITQQLFAERQRQQQLQQQC